MNKISVALSFLLLAVCTSFAQINEKRYTISDCITSFSDERVIKNKTGWAFWFIPADGIADTLSVKMSCVDKGIKTHEPHSHFEDELFYMVEGTSVVHLNGEEHVLNQGDAFYAPGSSSHNIRRVDDKPIRYLMFKREIRGKLSKPFLHFFGFSQKYFGDKPGKRCYTILYRFTVLIPYCHYEDFTYE